MLFTIDNPKERELLSTLVNNKIDGLTCFESNILLIFAVEDTKL